MDWVKEKHPYYSFLLPHFLNQLVYSYDPSSNPNILENDVIPTLFNADREASLGMFTGNQTFLSFNLKISIKKPFLLTLKVA